MAFCIIKDGKAIYQTRFFRNNLVPVEFDVACSVTPWGYVIPMGADSFNIIDFFETGKVHGAFNAIVIGGNRHAYEYFAQAKSSPKDIVRRRIPLDRMNYYVRSTDSDHERVITMALDMGHDYKTIKTTLLKMGVGLGENHKHSIVVSIDKMMEGCKFLLKSNVMPQPPF